MLLSCISYKDLKYLVSCILKYLKVRKGTQKISGIDIAALISNLIYENNGCLNCNYPHYYRPPACRLH